MPKVIPSLIWGMAQNQLGTTGLDNTGFDLL
jgi:hypothetical protein